MSFSTLPNIATMILCVAVLVQSVRMMRSMATIRDGSLAQVVSALDQSTGQARLVLSELKAALSECAGAARAVADGKELAEELSVMIGIADATAERLLNASSTAHRSDDAPDQREPQEDAADQMKAAA